MAGDWVKIYRQLKDHPLWTAEPFTRGQAWVDLIVLANWAPGFLVVRGVRVPLERGQLAGSYRFLSERWKWSKGKVERFLEELANDEQIEIQINNVTQVIEITNYDTYQSDGDANGYADGTQTGRRRDDHKNKQEETITTKNQEMGAASAATDDKCPDDCEPPAPPAAKPPAPAESHVRAESIPVPPELDSPIFIAARDRWFDQRRKKRLSLRPEHVIRQYERLLPLGPTDAAACLQESCDNDWAGIFPNKFMNGKSHAVGPGQSFERNSEQRDPAFGTF